MIEIPTSEGFEARALELDGRWLFFVRPQGGVYWLCGGGSDDQPGLISFDSDERQEGTRKLCALLGLTWEEIEADPAQSAGWQLECMRKLEDAPTMRAKLRGSTPEEIAEWREQMHTLEPGEVLRERLTGDDPLAGRN